MASKKKYSLTVSLKAEKELLNSFDWYEAQQENLGNRFLLHVLEKLNKIAEDPLYYPIKHNFFRETRVVSFPFLIIFRVNEEKKAIRIVSVFHTAQNPTKKYK